MSQGIVIVENRRARHQHLTACRQRWRIAFLAARCSPRMIMMSAAFGRLLGDGPAVTRVFSMPRAGSIRPNRGQVK